MFSFLFLPLTEEMKMMFPLTFLRCCSASLATIMGLVTFSLNMKSHSSAVTADTGLAGADIPALFTNTSNPKTLT